jgi:anti-sigma B factor antagonist
MVGPGLHDASLSNEITWVTNSPLSDAYRLLGPADWTLTRHCATLAWLICWGTRGIEMSADAEPFDAAHLRTDTKSDGVEATIILGGELDLRSVDQFLACVRDVLEGHPALIAVDARGVTFMDSSGLAALLHARSMSGHAEVPFRVGDASPMVRRVAGVAGVEELFMDNPPVPPDAATPPTRRPRGGK